MGKNYFAEQNRRWLSEVEAMVAVRSRSQGG
jgi:hypothetical protein